MRMVPYPSLAMNNVVMTLPLLFVLLLLLLLLLLIIVLFYFFCRC